MDFKEIRKISGLTQFQFSIAYGIPLQTLKQWETKKASPPTYLLDLLQFKVEYDKK